MTIPARIRVIMVFLVRVAGQACFPAGWPPLMLLVAAHAVRVDVFGVQFLFRNVMAGCADFLACLPFMRRVAE